MLAEWTAIFDRVGRVGGREVTWTTRLQGNEPAVAISGDIKKNSRINVCGGQSEKRGDPQEMSLDLYRGPDLWGFLPT